MEYIIKYFNNIEEKNEYTYGMIGIGFGLINPSKTTCWLNSFTQVMIHSPRLIRQLKNLKSIIINDEIIDTNRKKLNDLLKLILMLNNNILKGKSIKYSDYRTKIIDFININNENNKNLCSIDKIDDSDERFIIFLDKILDTLNLNIENFHFNKELYIKSNKISKKTINKVSKYLKKENLPFDYILSKKCRLYDHSYINKSPFISVTFYDNKTIDYLIDGDVNLDFYFFIFDNKICYTQTDKKFKKYYLGPDFKNIKKYWYYSTKCYEYVKTNKKLIKSAIIILKEKNIFGSLELEMNKSIFTIDAIALDRAPIKTDVQFKINKLFNESKETIYNQFCGSQNDKRIIIVEFYKFDRLTKIKKSFYLAGNPIKNYNFHIYRNKLYYTQCNSPFKNTNRPDYGQIYDSHYNKTFTSGDPQDIWVYLRGCYEYQKKNKFTRIHKYTIDNRDLTNSIVDIDITSSYIMLNHSNVIIIKISRPSDAITKLGFDAPLTLSDEITINEIINIKNINNICHKYILTGAIINVNLSQIHYVSIVRRNNKYYKHDDNKITIQNLNDINIKKETTLLIYEKLDNLEDENLSCFNLF